MKATRYNPVGCQSAPERTFSVDRDTVFERLTRVSDDSFSTNPDPLVAPVNHANRTGSGRAPSGKLPRILFISHYSLLYGANRSLLNLIDGLRPKGFEIAVGAPEVEELGPEVAARGLPFFTAPVHDWTSSRRNLRRFVHSFRRTLLGAFRFASQVRAWKPDCVYSNSSVSPTGWVLAKLLRVPHVWHLRELGDLDYGRGPLWGRSFHRRAYLSSAAVVAISEFVAQHLLGGEGAKSCHIIPNGVAFQAHFDEHRKAARKPFSDPDEIVFAMVGIIHQPKGQHRAIEALGELAREVPNARLVIAGTGDEDYIAECKRRAVELGIAERIDWLGYVKDPYTVFLSCDAFLMCSEAEGFGRVTAEAMSAARPVIGLDQGGTRELIKDGETGLLFGMGQGELADAMRKLVSNPDWAGQIGLRAWEAGRSEYSVERYSTRISEILAALPANKA